MKVKIKGKLNHVINGKEYHVGDVVEIEPWQLNARYYDEVVDDDKGASVKKRQTTDTGVNRAK